MDCVSVKDSLVAITGKACDDTIQHREEAHR
jgi:hypothetical protein